MRLRAPVRRALDGLCTTYDALVAPSRQTVASPIGVDFDKAYPGIGGGPEVIPAGNLAGQPAISVVSGFGENGLPTGIQFQGRAFADETLVAIAAEYQRRTDWHTRRPPV
jgi:aspartyl-tRNA(Asn)/glutamyl-tRNA(Gln) amidotransferase subunit A